MTTLLKSDVAALLGMSPDEVPTRTAIESKLRSIRYDVHEDRAAKIATCTIIGESGVPYSGNSDITPVEAFDLITASSQAYDKAIAQAIAVGAVMYEKKQVIANSKILEEPVLIETPIEVSEPVK